MRNFRELKEHVLNQCKETKNLENKIRGNDNKNGQLREEYEWIEGAEKQHENFAKHAQVSTAELTKQKKEYQKSKINSMK